MNSLKWISNEYYDLNGTHYETIDGPPSALEFSRFVHVSRPVLMKNCQLSEEVCRWTPQYLKERMGDNEISVAVTPNGRADAITTGPDGKQYFAEPHIEKMTMAQFLDSLNSGQRIHSASSEVHYLQSQNGNLFTNRYFDLTADHDSSEFEPLREDVPSEVHWCSEALDKSPDAVNLWIGDSSSVTSIHSDPYENVYAVVQGAKQFTVLPPTEGWCLRERTYPHASYTRTAGTSQLALVPSPPSTPSVRWSSVIDPTMPSALPPEAHPIHITVRAGEMLYLPAGWWHYVRQSDVTIAINYWYDMEHRGMNWVWLNFLRGLGEPPPGTELEDDSSNSDTSG